MGGEAGERVWKYVGVVQGRGCGRLMVRFTCEHMAIGYRN